MSCVAWWSIAFDVVISAVGAGAYGVTESLWVRHLPRWRCYLSVWLWAVRFGVCVAMLVGALPNSALGRLLLVVVCISAHWWNCRTFLRARYGETIAGEALKGWWRA